MHLEIWINLSSALTPLYSYHGYHAVRCTEDKESTRLPVNTSEL